MSRAVSAKVTKSCSSIRSASRRSSVHGTESDREIIFSPKNLRPRPKTAWKKRDLKRIEVISKDDNKKLLENEEAEKHRLELESQNRKRCLQELDAMRDEILGNNVDIFAEEKAEMESKLKNRALQAKHEQVTNSTEFIHIHFI